MVAWRRVTAAVALLFLTSSAARAANEAAIERAIQKGVAYLKSQQDKGSGTWPFPDARLGATALAGLTLLECGLPPTDSAIHKAANKVRQDSIGITNTYTLSTAILFLDRLGYAEDSPYIQSMAVRLLAGQNSSGGWNYDCPPLGLNETTRLKNYSRPLKGTGKANRKPPNRDASSLPKEIQQQLNFLDPAHSPIHSSDNSNTKFATLALWVARRHGMPVDRALNLVEARFRRTQNPDGGWGYFTNEGRKTDLSESLGSMTCSGLLGLAAGRGSTNEMMLRGNTQMDLKPPPAAMPKPLPDPLQDPVVNAGLDLLAKVIGKPISLDSLPRPFGTVQGDEYYLLWAIERVGVAFGIDTIGGQDWFAWGADYLVSKQSARGSWVGKYGAGGVDTCFALLFLRRANLSKDLTVSLRGQLNDPAKPREPMRNTEVNRRPTIQPPAAPPAHRQLEEGSAPSPAVKAATPPAAREPGAECGFEREVAALSQALIESSRSRQDDLLEKYKEGKGVAYTQALAAAIPRLRGQAKIKARDVLAERFTRMTQATLRARLTDEDAEIRRAAALACGMKQDNSHVPDLIPRLEDANAGVAGAAHVALKSLTGKDFGPSERSSKTETTAAMNRWNSWWHDQHKDK